MEIQPIVIGTAGHIDHGKSSLVQALTGTDPDRWQEEKERGMTIDLGFARIELADGRKVGIVDVPGHERFIRNMVAGASGIDLVVLVVAADDGVMPQTREHLAIMQLLGVKRGFVALTKIDMVDEELVALAEEDVREALAGTFLEEAPILHISSITGEGIPELKEHLLRAAMEAEPRSEEGVFRMPVQRVFSARGFGTIATGIPVSGSVKVGDTVEVLPGGAKGKVRGIHAYHESTDRARAGHSAALNLNDVSQDDVARGSVVATPGFFQPATMVGARVTALAELDRPVTNRMPVRVHTGTAEALGEVVLLDSDDIGPGESALVQLRMSQPLVCAPGDRFVLRLASPVVTLGGGVILEESRYRLKRFKRFVLDELERQADSLGSIEALLESHLARAEGRWVPLDDLAVKLKRSKQETRSLLSSLAEKGSALSPGPGERWVHAQAFELSLAEVSDAIDAWLAENPRRVLIDVRDVRNAVKIEPAFVAILLEELQTREKLEVLAGGKIRPAGRTVELDEKSAAARDRLVDALKKGRFQPPSPDELSGTLGASSEEVQSLLQLVVDEGLAQRVGGELYLATEWIDEARTAIVENCEAHGHLEIPVLRDRLGTTRKFLIPLLEYFDAQGLTLRQGGHRVLKRA